MDAAEAVSRLLDAKATAGLLRGMSARASLRGRLRAAGVGLVQYRDKTGSPQEVLRGAAVLREVFAGADAVLILNDRADLAVLAEFDGVHVGQGDLSPEDARAWWAAGKVDWGFDAYTRSR